MKKNLKLSMIGKPILMFLLSILFINAFARGGVDTYVISLNGKVLVRQSLADPLDLKDLPLTAANSKDKLVIQYMQCNAPSKVGKNRVITLKNAEGTVVKEWKFSDAIGENSAMVIPVKEILALQTTSNSSLSFFYSADGLPKTIKLAALQPKTKTNKSNS